MMSPIKPVVLAILIAFGPSIVDAAQLTFSFEDPAGDHTGRIDVIRAAMSFDDGTGAYEVDLVATPDRPFVGQFRINLNFFNPDTGSTACDPAQFNHNLADFDLATPVTTLTVSGANSRLTAWSVGDRVASGGPIPLGVPDCASVFSSSVSDLPLVSPFPRDRIAEGEFATIASSDPPDPFSQPGPLNTTAPLDSGADRTPSVATDRQGVWIAVWSSTDQLNGTLGTDTDILVSRSLDEGATWSPPRAIDPNAAADVAEDTGPIVATDRAGVWITVWTTTVGGDSDVFYSTSVDDGVSWAPPVFANPDAGVDAGADIVEALATDASGNWILLSNSENETTAGARTATITSGDNGATWTAGEDLETDVDVDPVGISLATTETGTWRAAWMSFDNAAQTVDLVVATSTTRGLSWGTPEIVHHEDFLIGDPGNGTSIATDGSGTWVIAWNYSFSLRTSRTADDGVSWSTTGFPIGGTALYPKIATDAADTWITAGSSPDHGAGDSDRFRLRRSLDNGATWLDPEDLSASCVANLPVCGGCCVTRNSIATDRQGVWLVAWDSTDPLGGTIGNDADILVSRALICDGCECGNGILELAEECDDGNLVNADGCSSACTIEAVCGNGVVEPGEECDDGVANSDVEPDACRGDCALPRCGDVVIDSGEQCDDGNAVATDGCTITCLLDSDGDEIPDDGDNSGSPVDNPCVGPASGCDDNCPGVLNPEQGDADVDGVGDVCDLNGEPFIQVPVFWCAVDGSSAAADPQAAAELLAARLRRVTETTHGLQAQIGLVPGGVLLPPEILGDGIGNENGICEGAERCGRELLDGLGNDNHICEGSEPCDTAMFAGFEILDGTGNEDWRCDPGESCSGSVPIILDPSGPLSGQDVSQAHQICHQAWCAVGLCGQGVIALNAQLEDGPGAGVLDVDDPTNPPNCPIAGRDRVCSSGVCVLHVRDPNDGDPRDIALGHEIGHTLGLFHGDGVDDDNDLQFDEDDDDHCSQEFFGCLNESLCTPFLCPACSVNDKDGDGRFIEDGGYGDGAEDCETLRYCNLMGLGRFDSSGVSRSWLLQRSQRERERDGACRALNGTIGCQADRGRVGGYVRNLGQTKSAAGSDHGILAFGSAIVGESDRFHLSLESTPFEPNAVGNARYGWMVDLDADSTTGASSSQVSQALGVAASIDGVDLIAEVHVGIPHEGMASSTLVKVFDSGNFITLVNAGVVGGVANTGYMTEAEEGQANASFSQTAQNIWLDIPRALLSPMALSVKLQAFYEGTLLPVEVVTEVGAVMLAGNAVETCTVTPEVARLGEPLAIEVGRQTPNDFVDFYLGARFVGTATVDSSGKASIGVATDTSYPGGTLVVTAAPLGQPTRATCTVGLQAVPQMETPPTPVSGTVITVRVGEPIVVEVSASDSDPLDLLTLSTIGVSPGSSFTAGAPDNPAAGRFEWTPASGQEGEYSINFKGRDTQGLSTPDHTLNIHVTTDEQQDVLQMEAGSVTIGASPTILWLVNNYRDPIIVATMQHLNNSEPVVLRVFNVTASSFGVRLQRPSGGKVAEENVSYWVVERGVWSVGGLKIEADKYLSTQTSRKGAWNPEVRNYGQAYATPVVLGQVMSENDPRWSVFFAHGATRTSPPSSSALRMGKMIGEDTDIPRANEIIGYIVVEATHTHFAGVEMEAAVGLDTVFGVQNNPPFPYTFNNPFASPPTVALAALAGVDGGDGGWAQIHGPVIATATTLNLSIDEDQIGDAERSHTSEQVAYAAFSGPLVFPVPAACEFDEDCDDGFYCNGPEACDGLQGCLAGADPCPGQSCDEATDVCVGAGSAKMESVSVMAGGPGATRVELINTYADPVIACTPVYSSNDTPIVVRLDSVSSDAFDIYLQNPGDLGPVDPDPVHCLVVEQGSWMMDGHPVEAAKYESTITDKEYNWLGAARPLTHAFTNPVVLGQVMSSNDPLWSTYWQQGSVRTSPPTSLALRNGKTVAEDPDVIRATETVGYIVLEQSNGAIAGVPFEAALGPDTVQGIDNGPPFQYAFNVPFAAAPTVAVATQAGVDGSDGSWAYLFGPAFATPASLFLAVDEDQIFNSERGHTTEQVAYVAFQQPLVYPRMNCVSDGQCDDGFYCNGVESCNPTSGTCQQGEAVVCDDGIECTIDLCDEAADRCESTASDVACDNGSFCDGTETCDPHDGCQAGANPCGSGPCDEAGDACPGPGPAGRAEWGAVTVGSEQWAVVVLANTYLDPVVVTSIAYANNTAPAVTRIRNVGPASFEVLLQNPSDATLHEETVHYLVVESGSWNMGGVNIEARKYASVRTANDADWSQFDVQGYTQMFQRPVVLGQVMTFNDPDFSVFWSRGASRGAAPSGTELGTGKTVAEDPDTTRESETIGYVVVESGHGFFGATEYECGLGEDSVAGVVNAPPYPYFFSTSFAAPPEVAVVTQSGMDGFNGGWMYAFDSPPATATRLNLGGDEDQLSDAERSRTTEQAAFCVFQTTGSYP